MSFYGKVINYLTKAFSKIKVGSVEISAKEYDDTLTFIAGDSITLKSDTDNRSVTFAHDSPEAQSGDKTSISISKTDISEGAQIIMTAIGFDSKGHKTGTNTSSSFNLNIDTVKNKINNLNTDFQTEKVRAQEADTSLQTQINDLTTNLNAEIVNRTKGDENLDSEIDKRLGNLKKEILGNTELLDTFDTLQKIEEWIEGDGVNATELAQEVAKEALLRGNKDRELQNQINFLENQVNSDSQNIELIMGEVNQTGSIKQQVASEANLRKAVDEALETNINNINNNINNIDTTLGNINETLKTHTTDISTKVTKTDANVGLPEDVTSDETHYVATIIQENGVIIPKYIKLPLNTEKIYGTYYEESGNFRIALNTKNEKGEPK